MNRLLFGLLVMGCAVPAVAVPPVVTAVRCPDGGVQPQAAIDSGGKIHLIYLKGEDGKCDVFYVTSVDGARTWGKALRVNSQPGAAIATGTVRGAQIALGKGGRPHVAWMGSSVAEPKAPGDATPMLYTRMNDAGDGFEAQRNVITKAAGLDGGGAVAADPDSDRVAVAWHAPIPGERGEENRTVFYALSNDGGRTFAPEVNAVSTKTGACGCCGMRAVFTPSGVDFLYRDVAGEDRSMRVAEIAGTSSVAGPVLQAWAIKTCPMSTAALTRVGPRVLAAWETAGQVQFEVIGERGAPVIAPGKGNNRKHPALAVNKAGDVLLAWSEGTAWKRGGSVHWQVYDRSFRPVADGRGMKPDLAVWSLPTAVATPDGGFVVIY